MTLKKGGRGYFAAMFYVLIVGIVLGMVSCGTYSISDPFATLVNQVAVDWVYFTLTPTASPTLTITSTPSPTQTPIPTPAVNFSYKKTFNFGSAFWGQGFISFIPNTGEYRQLMIQGPMESLLYIYSSTLILDTGDITVSSNLMSPDGMVAAVGNRKSSFYPEISIAKINGDIKFNLSGATGCFYKWMKSIIRLNCILVPYAFSPDGSFLVSATHPDGTMTQGQAYPFQLWDIKTGALVGEHIGVGYYHHVLFSPDGKTFLAAAQIPETGGYSRWELFDVQPLTLKWKLMMGLKQFIFARFSPSGEMIALSSNNLDIKIVNSLDGTITQSIDISEGVAGLAFSPDGEYIFALLGGDMFGNRIGVFDVGTGTLLKSFNLPFQNNSGIAVSPDGKYVFIPRSTLVSTDPPVIDSFLDMYSTSP